MSCHLKKWIMQIIIKFLEYFSLKMKTYHSSFKRSVKSLKDYLLWELPSHYKKLCQLQVRRLGELWMDENEDGGYEYITWISELITWLSNEVHNFTCWFLACKFALLPCWMLSITIVQNQHSFLGWFSNISALAIKSCSFVSALQL